MCRVAHSVLKHHLRQTRVAAFITERTGILHSQRSVRSLCSRRLRGGPSSTEVARLGWLFWGERRPMLDVDSRDHLTHEVRRTHLPRARVNRGTSYAPRVYDKPLIQSTWCFTTLTFQTILDTLDTYRHQRSLKVARYPLASRVDVSSSPLLLLGSAPQNGGYRVQ